MKKQILQLAFLLLSNLVFCQNAWIRVNQIGYLPSDVKVAVLVSKNADLVVFQFEIVDALTEKTVYKSLKINTFSAWGAFAKSFRLDFSDFTEGGISHRKYPPQ